MNLQEMTNEQIFGEIGKTIANMPQIKQRLEIYELAVELERRVLIEKHPYTVKYKWATNDKEWKDIMPVNVMATSHKAAAQTLKDSDVDKFTGDVIFLVGTSDDSVAFTFELSELE